MFAQIEFIFYFIYFIFILIYLFIYLFFEDGGERVPLKTFFKAFSLAFSKLIHNSTAAIHTIIGPFFIIKERLQPRIPSNLFLQNRYCSKEMP